jgi:hypothetical protein
VRLSQISASGKTTSLGDHDTEEEAARAFDRAAINIKGGTAALINYAVAEYADEVPRLVSCSLPQDISPGPAPPPKPLCVCAKLW